MKKILIILLLLVLTGCVGLGDWEYKLPSEYKIVRINSNNIHFVTDDNDYVIKDKIQ